MSAARTPVLSDRDRSILRAVAAGTAELATGAGRDLFLDGRCCCDQLAAHRLTRAGLIAPDRRAPAGHRARDLLTASGSQALARA